MLWPEAAAATAVEATEEEAEEEAPPPPPPVPIGTHSPDPSHSILYPHLALPPATARAQTAI